MLLSYFIKNINAGSPLEISFLELIDLIFLSFSSATEVTAAVLPRLCKIEFDSGVIDELLFVDMPFECRLPSGLIMLEYGRAVQESIYKQQLRVVRVGVLRIKFTPILKVIKIFCTCM